MSSVDTDDRSVAQILHEDFEDEDGKFDAPPGSLAHLPVEKLVPEANMVDHGQSMCGAVYGSFALRAAMIRYYDGDIDRAMVALEECPNRELFARLWLLAEEADLEGRPRPWDA